MNTGTIFVPLDLRNTRTVRIVKLVPDAGRGRLWADYQGAREEEHDSNWNSRAAYFTGHPECGARPKTYAFTSGGTRERSQDAGTPFGNTRKSLGHSSRGPEGYKCGQARQGRTRVGPADRQRRGGKSGGLHAYRGDG